MIFQKKNIYIPNFINKKMITSKPFTSYSHVLVAAKVYRLYSSLASKQASSKRNSKKQEHSTLRQC
jgi:hypothetical protein